LYGTSFPFRHWRADPDGVDDGAAEEVLLVEDPDPVLLPQFPKPAWHPVPQYADVEPHHPLALQQLPSAKPRHV